jgi:hypothetical protein
MKPQKKKGRGVASAFLKPRRNALSQEQIDNLNASYDAEDDRREHDHEFRGGGAMVAQPDATAVRRPPRGDNVPSTMDKHGVTDIVRELSTHPTPAEAQSEFQRLGGSNWNPADPYSADNPAVAKQLRAEELARKRKIR